jgi:LacI family transcriptional regulator
VTGVYEDEMWSTISPSCSAVDADDADMKCHHIIGDASASVRVLVVLNTNAAWSRGILRGFAAAAQEYGWAVLHYHPDADMKWLSMEWMPAAAVIGPELGVKVLAELGHVPLVSVTVDRCASGIASVCVDDQAVGALAAKHLLDTGIRHFSTFRFDDSPFAVAREYAFVQAVLAAGAHVTAGWGSEEAPFEGRVEAPAAILEWLRGLTKPCGIFTITDGWGRTVARYVRAAGLRVPEEIALIGADNDVLECELLLPPLSSVVIPWQELGRNAAALVQLGLCSKSIEGKRRVLSPITVMARRSSDVLAIGDPIVAKAVRWIRSNADLRLTVSMVARAVGGGRKRLERRFRATLDRTVHDEIRRSHVDVAKRLLESTDIELVHVAKQSGFATAALLNVAFRREVGMPPGRYRRRAREACAGPGDD